MFLNVLNNLLLFIRYFVLQPIDAKWLNVSKLQQRERERERERERMLKGEKLSWEERARVAYLCYGGGGVWAAQAKHKLLPESLGSRDQPPLFGRN